MTPKPDLLALWRQQHPSNAADTATLQQYHCDGVLWQRQPEAYIARLANIQASSIHSTRTQPAPTPAPTIVLIMLLLGMMLGARWLSPWLNQVLPLHVLLLLLVAVLLLFFAALLYPHLRHHRARHRYNYQLWLYPHHTPPILAITLTELDTVQALQTWLHQYMPPNSVCEPRLNADVIQDWLAEQHTTLENMALLADLRLQQQVLYSQQQPFLPLRYMQALHIHKVAGPYQAPQLNEYADFVVQVWVMVLIGLYFYLPDEPVPALWLWAVCTLVAVLSAILMFFSLPDVFPAIRKKSAPAAAEAHYLLMATSSLSHMDVPIAAAYDFNLLMGLRQLLLEQQQPR
ncbi:hypothetical protein LVJ82_14190 [Vitreoscilla massiliensis]|uniref:Uncharacterized protein n=1 Tax=Vitreoscilla massiliensis TaxID=1689272 RepID=A0ABY4DZV6_9NEIS|nr:hypothetical protein [Vitreoscilla massiliensis]UOO88603.1 hypothetical protein LVJ82_14190 [Vitreoscilla massiliensis]